MKAAKSPSTRHTPPKQDRQGADQLAPSLVATAHAWIVGWEEDRGAKTVLRVSTAARLAQMTKTKTKTKKSVALDLAASATASGLRLATAGDHVLAAWRDANKIWVRPLNGTGQGTTKAVPISGGNNRKSEDVAGPPEVISLTAKPPIFAIVWVAGKVLHAAKVDASGKVSARSTLHGGNLRPPNHRRRRVKGKPPRPGANITKGTPQQKAPPRERARPALQRPRLNIVKGKLHVRWAGGHWKSDDQASNATYTQTLGWKNDMKHEPKIVPRQSVWDRLGPVAIDAKGKTVTVVSDHDPNGGPWQLRLQRLGESAKAPPFTAEDAGPFKVDLLTSGKDLIAAWTSPQRQAVVVARFDAASRAQLRSLPTKAAPGDAAVTLGRRGAEIRVAYVAVDAGGACRIVVAKASAGQPVLTQPAVPSSAITSKVLPRTRAIYADPTLAAFDDGRFVVVAKDESQGNKPRLVALFFNAAGQRKGALRPLTRALPRIDFTTSARVGKDALIAFTACGNASMCEPSRVKIAVLGPKKILARPRAVTPAKTSYGQPALAVRGDRVALLVKRGSWGAWSLRRTHAKSGADAVTALKKAKKKAVTIPFSDSNYAGAGAIAFTAKGIVMVHRDKEAGHPVVRVVFVPPKGSPKVQMRLPAVEYAGWGAQRIATYDDGVVLLGVRQRGDRVDTVLRFLSADGTTVNHMVVLARAMAPRAPRVVVSQAGVAAAWYDRSTDGNYVAFVDRAGHRQGPLRLDDPQKRASFGAPLLAPAARAGMWHALWADPYTGHYALYQALIHLP
ncbi:MAG: hypothetical protein KAI47_20555 [Deltaproteobacteria bacterium]|nr:hypothetical protein [Deltaproteobacteria bacterium]